ncbi:MAG: D-alanine--D-alanine ligase family protein [Actinomycetales bacterium]
MQPTPAPPHRPRVAVLFGGRSGEHPISCVTAGGVLAAIDRDAYDVVAVGIDTEGRWWLADDSPGPWELRGDVLPSVDGASPGRGGGAAVEVVPSTAVGGLRLLPTPPAGGVPIAVDVTFPLLHGAYGEDGTIQGLLDLAGARYVGSGVLASAAGMDKPTMKTLLRAAGVPVAEWVAFTRDDWHGPERGELLARVEKLGSPVFVKPARAGSSLGVARVDGGEQELDAAVSAAAEHDPRILVEAAIPGREVECGVLDAGPGSPPAASVCGEIVLRGGRTFYDFEAKYLDPDAVRLDCPADLPGPVADRVRELAVVAFRALGCEGLARVDTFVTGDTRDSVVVNEVNTMPGFTPLSMYPRMWQATGVGYPELVDRLIRAALARPAGLR